MNVLIVVDQYRMRRVVAEEFKHLDQVYGNHLGSAAAARLAVWRVIEKLFDENAYEIDAEYRCVVDPFLIRGWDLR